jgi:PcfJ-like protein
METLHNTAAPFAIRFPAMVESLYKDPNGATKGNGIENAIAMQFAAMGTAGSAFKRHTFRELLMVVFHKKCYGILRNPGYIEILANIAAFGNKTVNLANTWVKDSLTAEGQLASLIRHLFAKYEVPAFMEYVFAESSKIPMLWYIQLGRGDSVQNLCAFPAGFTKKMAHEFRNTPGGLTVEQAIRRAQALGYGANASVADAITWSASLEEITHAGFKALVIRFIAKNAPVVANVAAIQLVVDYAAVMFRADNTYNFKGRTWASVSRLAAEYHLEVAKRREAEARNGWLPAEIGNYEVVKGKATYKIIQLTDSEALYEEGCEMSHCVADYAMDCEEGRAVIFSLRKFTEGAEGFETLATLDVSPVTMNLVEARAKYNDDVSAEAEIHILAWAKAQGITIACELYSYYQHRQYVPPVVPVQPAVHLPAEMPRIVPIPREEPPFEPYEPYRPAAGYGFGSDIHIDGATAIRIIFLIIKILWLVSRCS